MAAIDHCGYCGGDVPAGSECLSSESAGRCAWYQQRAAALLPHRIRELEGHAVDMESHGWKDAAETLRALIAAHGVPVVHDCPTCAHHDTPGAKGPCKSCTVLWKPENGGREDNWTPMTEVRDA